jgi:hypothetical protein
MMDLLDSFFDPIRDFLTDFMFDYLDLISTTLNDGLNVLRSGSVWGVSFGSGVSTVLGVTTGVGASILSICMMMEFLTIMTRSDILKIETAILIVGKYMVSAGIITAAPNIMRILYTELGLSLVSGLPSIALTSGIRTMIEAKMATMNAFDIIIMYVTMSLPLLGTLVSIFIVFIMSAARIFELNVYCAIAPIPCAFFPYSEGGSGFNQTTLRFFKSYAAICLTGGVMAVCYQIYASAVVVAWASLGVSVAAAMAKMCFLSLLLAIAITKSGGWAKTAMGVG